MDNIIKIYKKSSSPYLFAKNYFKYLNDVLNSINEDGINALAEFLEKSRIRRGTIFVIGNGGSATTATTMSNDLGFDILKKTSTKKPFRMHSLTDSNAVISAIGNDIGYENIFYSQLQTQFKQGDCLIVISASGNSPNLVKAAKWVKNKKGRVFGLLGFDGGKLKKICDDSIHVLTNKNEYGIVEDSHLILNHIMAHWFQNKLK